MANCVLQDIETQLYYLKDSNGLESWTDNAVAATLDLHFYTIGFLQSSIEKRLGKKTRYVFQKRINDTSNN